MAVSAKKKEIPVNTETVKVEVDNEKENLKAQIEELKAQMQLMSQMMTANVQTQVTAPKNNNRPIRFVNMVPGTLILKGTDIWKIEGQFNYADFMKNEAVVVVNNMQPAIRKGWVYIADADFVDEQNLTTIYQHMLSDEVLKTLFTKDSNYIIDAYKMANDGQKEIIENMIELKKVKGEFVDANVLMEIGKLSGKDFMSIEPEDEE